MMSGMELDLVAGWTLWFFGACFAGTAIGFLVAKLSHFEIGLGAGLLVIGATSLWFVPRFALEYRELTTSPWRTAGTVVAIEDRPANAAGDVTTPVAVVEFVVDGRSWRTDSRGGTSLDVGDATTVVYAGGDPRHARTGSPEEMLGGILASVLFGTFPFSAALFFLITAALPENAPDAKRRARAERQERSYATWLANLLMLGGITSVLVTRGPVMERILIAFGVSTLGMWLHVAQGVRLRADPRWTLGVGVVALNFSVWVLALWVIGRPGSPFQ
jgi:hypothetical protein